MLKQKKFKAFIVGAGRIASGFDNPKSKQILTHAHAYKKHSQVDFIGFYDTDFRKAKLAAKKWSVNFYQDLKKAINENKPDIISICTPDKNHFEQLKMISQLKDKPRIVICEKPLTVELHETKKIVQLYNRKKIPVLVNHSRRFDKTVQDVSKRIKSGDFGKIILASAIYGKGILHSGTHIIDLARYFFGEVVSSKILYKITDHEEEDKTLGVFIKFKNCEQFYLQAGDSRQYDLFEFNIIGEKRRICFTDLGFRYFEQKVVNDPIFLGYKILSQPISKKTNFDWAMFNLVDNAVRHITIGEMLICDLNDATKTHKTCLAIRNN